MRLARAYSFSLSLAIAGLLVACGGGGGGGDGSSDAGGDAALEGSSLTGVETGVPVNRVFERSITNTNAYANKFADVTLMAEYTAPSGRKVSFWGFYDGDGAGGQDGNVWKLRFMPDEPGTWTYTYAWSDGTTGGSGTFDAVTARAGRGLLQPYEGNPRWLAYGGKNPVFLKSYYIGAGGITGVPIDWAADRIYSKISARGYNHVQMNMLPIGWTYQKPSDAPADHLSQPLWRESPRVQNLKVWKRMEEHVAWLNSMNIGIHFFMGLDPKPSGSADQYFALQRLDGMSGDDRAFYIRYLAARLAPFANISGWNYTWETDGNGSERAMADLLAQYDPWSHLRTYHDEYPQDNDFGNGSYNFAGIENHGYFGNGNGNPATDSASHYQATIDAYRGKPVYMVEGNGLWRACWAKDAAETSITRSAWAVTLAGGSFTWQDTPDCDFTDPSSSMFTWPSANPMVDRVEVLYKVMTQDVVFHRMAPRNDLLAGCWNTFDGGGPVPASPCYALAEPGKQYVVFKEDGGAFNLTVDAGTYRATWIDTRTGARQAVTGGSVSGTGAPVQFVSPSSSTDWALVLTAQ
ncbi:hypothetical protein SVA_0823 [Sulfurifustis variabilis]|uniref:DUF5060 domain-containing protein n=1 Tax=Sulfurifustis variabilis TaxID=1675686 RepID=A0A1B4V4C5_9GAMM|nr:DUF5060 domain-containing protein [Sulfurifustis variabilis]BAU47402.1 hypothetical protein SVA_0823 [Sulfurifustis variabilis]